MTNLAPSFLIDYSLFLMENNDNNNISDWLEILQDLTREL